VPATWWPEWNHDRAKLDGRQQDLPQGHDVGEHDGNAVPAPNAEVAEEVGDPIRALGDFGEGQFGFRPVFVDHP
jgi:hypothetical protein